MRFGVLGLAALLGLAGTASAATMLVDFGAALGAVPTTVPDNQGRMWNSLTSVAGDTAPVALNDSTGGPSGISISMSNPTARADAGIGWLDNGENNSGPTAPTGDALARGYPGTATQDSLFGSVATFGGTLVAPDVGMTLSGLSVGTQYDFYFFAARGGVTDTRSALYTVTGSTGSGAVSLNASNNTGNVVSVLGVTPDISGNITIKAEPGADNSNGSKFYYLGVMELVAVPEPASLGIVFLGAMALLKRRNA